ncbi:hypothetical protein FRC19_002682 [Serendipita sp. 401]|nr:hypothetical protein FRC19_002682 [Serendipita sp. 401]
MDNPDHPPHNDTVTRPPNSVGLTSWDGGSDIFQHPTTFFGPFNGDNQILSNLENSLVGRERNGEDYDAAVDDAHYYGAALPLPLPVLDTPTNATRSTQPSALVEYVTTTTTLITAMATQVQQGVAAGGHEAERETEGIVTLTFDAVAPSKHSRFHPSSPTKRGKRVTKEENTAPKSLQRPRYSRRDITKSSRVQQASTDSKFVCNVPTCAMRLGSLFSLQRHMKGHDVNEHDDAAKGLKCPFPSCRKDISRLDNVYQHLERCHGIVGRTCPYCKKDDFYSKMDLSRHMMEEEADCHPSRHEMKGQQEMEE